MDKLNAIYEETNGKIWPVWKLYKQLIKEKGMGIEKVVNAVEIAVNRLPYMESLYKQLKDEVDKMQRTRQQLENYLHKLKEEIASTKELLKSYSSSCERKRQEAENLNKEILRLEAIISRLQNNNEEYLKIKKTFEEEVSRVLIDSKVLLQFALASVIEAIRRNTGKYKNLLFNDTLASSTSTPPQGSLLSHIEGDRDIILEEVNRLYDSLLHHFTNSIMANAAGASSCSSSDRFLFVLSHTLNLTLTD